MNKVESISFPRSGHKLTTDLLRAYFGPTFRYEAELPDGTSSESFDFLKRHDMDLNVPILTDRWYIVQVRDPFEAIHSWAKMDDSDYRRVFADKLDYFAGFVRKWVLSDIPNRRIVFYKNLVEFPALSLTEILRAFGKPIDSARVLRAVNSVHIRRSQTPSFFLE